ncbi:unnamed protein product [Caenorhabditis angaria]|uniref:Uncharacterized protein n=1 Tax=Caenorhabditis angaria TaxID=860376 RepID=A0A9P1NCB9_9PELO|nr:unnamed protein product [Caenorhabditis angaria]
MTSENNTHNIFDDTPSEYLIISIPNGIFRYFLIPFVILMYSTPDEERKSIIYPIYKIIYILILADFISLTSTVLVILMFVGGCTDCGLLLVLLRLTLFVLPYIFGGNSSSMLFFLLIGVQRLIVILDFEKLEKYVQGKYLNRALTLIVFWMVLSNLIDVTDCPIEKYCAVYAILTDNFDCAKKQVDKSVTYTISHWKRLRDMMSCCKCCKNRVYVENLATTMPEN